MAELDLKARILDYLEDDLLDYPYALQIVREELGPKELAPARVLLTVLLDLLKKEAIIVGSYKGPNEIEPWSDSVEETIERLKSEIGSDPEAKVKMFWIGLPKHRFKGH